VRSLLAWLGVRATPLGDAPLGHEAVRADLLAVRASARAETPAQVAAAVDTDIDGLVARFYRHQSC
jgi:hypothetical protein